MNNTLQFVINEVLNHTVNDYNLNALTDRLTPIRQGVRIDSDSDPIEQSLWLKSEIDELAVSPINFDNSTGVPIFSVSALATGRPQIIYGATPDTTDPLPPLSIHLGAPAGSNFYVAPEGSISLGAIKDAIQNAIDAYEVKHGHEKGEIKADIYQSGEKVVFELQPRLFPNVYLTVKPSFDKILQRINFASFEVDDNSKVYARVYMNWLFGDEFKSIADQYLKIPVGERMSKEIDSLVNFNKDTPFGSVSAHLTDINFGQFWVDHSELHFTVIAKGTTKIEGKVDPNAFTKASADNFDSMFDDDNSQSPSPPTAFDISGPAPQP